MSKITYDSVWQQWASKGLTFVKWTFSNCYAQSPVGSVKADLAAKWPGHEQRAVGRELGRDNHTTVTNIGHHLVQLDRRRCKVHRPITQFTAVQVERQKPNSVAKRRRDNPPVHAERDLLDVTAADVRFRDVVGEPTPVFTDWLRTVRSCRESVFGGRGRRKPQRRGWVGDIDGVMPRKDRLPRSGQLVLSRRERRQVVVGGRRFPVGRRVGVDDVAVYHESDAAQSTDAVRRADNLLAAFRLPQHRLWRPVQLIISRKTSGTGCPPASTWSPTGWSSSPSVVRPSTFAVAGVVVFALNVVNARPLTSKNTNRVFKLLHNKLRNVLNQND